jgi:hypothetical protein
MPSSLADRLAARTGCPRVLHALAEDLSAAELQSLLLAVFQQRARSVRPADLVAPPARRPLFAPSSVDARVFNLFERLAFEAAAVFEAVDLSPAAPFGTSAALGSIDQNSVLTTIRRAELLGDSTSALALMAAGRRRALDARAPAPVRLCSSHRVARLQPTDVPGFTPHFRLFALASAGRDTGSEAFEAAELRAHVSVFLTLFRLLNEHGFTLGDPLVEIADVRLTGALVDRVPGARERVRETVRAHRPGGSAPLLAELGLELPSDVVDPIAELEGLAHRYGLESQLFGLARLRREVADPLETLFPEARFRFSLARLEGLSYYSGICFRISPRTADDERFAVVDGGVSAWTFHLLQDRKERFLGSGIGEEFVCRRYRTAGSVPR